jgi:hypothetical protein
MLRSDRRGGLFFEPLQNGIESRDPEKPTTANADHRDFAGCGVLFKMHGRYAEQPGGRFQVNAERVDCRRRSDDGPRRGGRQQVRRHEKTPVKMEPTSTFRRVASPSSGFLGRLNGNSNLSDGYYLRTHNFTKKIPAIETKICKKDSLAGPPRTKLAATPVTVNRHTRFPRTRYNVVASIQIWQR